MLFADTLQLVGVHCKSAPAPPKNPQTTKEAAVGLAPESLAGPPTASTPKGSAAHQTLEYSLVDTRFRGSAMTLEEKFNRWLADRFALIQQQTPGAHRLVIIFCPKSGLPKQGE